MGVFPDVDIFGAEAGTRDQLLDEATQDGFTQARAEMVGNGLGLEPAVVRGAHTVREMYGLEEDEAQVVARGIFVRLLGKDSNELEEEVAQRWEETRQWMFAPEQSTE